MSANGRRMGLRDYKRPRRGGLHLDLAQLRGFALGLGLGLLVAAIIYIGDHRVRAAVAAPLRPVPQPRAPDELGLSRVEAGSNAATAADAAAPAKAPATTSATAPAATVGRFDFYQMLPRARVVVAAHEHLSSIPPAAPVQQPGTYLLQVGSYRDAALAERVRAEVARLGIVATVQRIAVGPDVWDRVRVGPVRDLSALNRLRRQLQAAKLGSLVVRVEN